MNIGDALDGSAVVDAHAVALDATQIGQGGFGGQIAARTLEALAHDAGGRAPAWPLACVGVVRS